MEDVLARWWEEAKADSHAAIGGLYNYYKTQLIHMAKGILNDDHYAEDAFNDAFYKVIKNLTIIKTDYYSYYLRKAVINNCFDILRKSKQNRSFQEEFAIINSNPSVSTPEVEDVIIDRINKLLTGKEQRVFWGSFEGPILTVAKSLGITAVYARQILYMARQKLRKDPLIQEYFEKHLSSSQNTQPKNK